MTVEPCLMCVGALVHARVKEVVFGAVEPRSGALVSTVRGHEIAGLNHRVTVTGGVLEADCRDLIQHFSRQTRLIPLPHNHPEASAHEDVGSWWWE